MSKETEIARVMLNEWAKWLLRSGGYAHQSTMEMWRDGSMSSTKPVFGSSPPKDVEPNRLARTASIAMRHLRELDVRSAGLLETLYLRGHNQSLQVVATHLSLNLGQLNTKRRTAETKFYGLLKDIPIED